VALVNRLDAMPQADAVIAIRAYIVGVTGMDVDAMREAMKTEQAHD
jgi:hypothetical protein